MPSAALGAALAPLLTVCSAVLDRGTPATLSAMLGWLCQDKSLYNRHMLLSLENFPSVFGLCRSLAPIYRVTQTTSYPMACEGHCSVLTQYLWYIPEEMLESNTRNVSCYGRSEMYWGSRGRCCSRITFETIYMGYSFKASCSNNC